MEPRRDWQVVVFGGASGVGKTSVSYRLAQHFGVGLTEMDDFPNVLERMTTPAQQPALHYFRQHTAAVLAMDDEQMLAHTRSVAEAMAVAMELVIANHFCATSARARGRSSRGGRARAGTTASGYGARPRGSACRPSPPGRGRRSWNGSSPHSTRRNYTVRAAAEHSCARLSNAPFWHTSWPGSAQHQSAGVATRIGMSRVVRCWYSA